MAFSTHLTSAASRPAIQPPVGLGVQTSSHQFIGTPSSLPNALADPSRPSVEKAKPGRVKTITRREIQRKAEAILVKPPPIKTPTLMKRPVVEIPVYNAGGGSPAPGRVEDLREDGDGGGDGQEIMLGSRRESMQSSAIGEGREGSVDAGEEGDDESELSDLGEDENEGDEDAEDDTVVLQRHQTYSGLISEPRGGSNESDADDDDDDDESEGDQGEPDTGGHIDVMDVDPRDDDSGERGPEIQEFPGSQRSTTRSLFTKDRHNGEVGFL